MTPTYKEKISSTLNTSDNISIVTSAKGQELYVDKSGHIVVKSDEKLLNKLRARLSEFCKSSESEISFQKNESESYADTVLLNVDPCEM